MAATFALKSSLRKSMLKTLRGISDQDVERQSQAVFRLLLDQPFFKQAKSVGCYLSMAHGELRTDGIVTHLLKRGTSLYTPYLPFPAPTSSTESHNPTAPAAATPKVEVDMKMLRLYSQADLEKCPLDKWGIVDPGEYRRDVAVDDSKREDALNSKSPPLDLILIPGVAFDEECNRLGRGKAYYDRFLLSYTSNRPSPLLVAVALSPQVLSPGEKVPTTDTDFQLDAVVSPEGITWRKGAEDKMTR
ncbi:5-formyltetrahydrofolate cyclo-ligase [Kwoniella shandongensis]|uniref:5-formyltetrahydrofolate cyclo-ligase n=1 Tax=Kwoniella shandongensis TaxID=1734106 RepID=A0A5M6C1Q2_9TREE|nr:5-formyltetrahydrofolate cyclo-ligase [Kwoniella shandongensis]KAA5529057.1 5-formyltetrahydrofolate cyclo-ligase [Kwoniella shandongensis]